MMVPNLMHVTIEKCPVCREDADNCMWDLDHPICPDCKEPNSGPRWNGGRCLDCHERALLPSPCNLSCDIDCPHNY